MTKEELLNKYTDRKNNYYLAYNKLSDSTKDYVSTAHLLVKDVFSDLIEDIKNLPNEPKTVSNNENTKKFCAHENYRMDSMGQSLAICLSCGEIFSKEN